MTKGTDEDLSYLDQILYQIIFIKCIPLGNGFMFMHEIKSFDIEIANTFKNLLLKHLSVIKLLEKKQGSIEKKSIDKITKEEIDLNKLIPHGYVFVTRVLNLIKTKELDQNEIEIIDLDTKFMDKTTVKGEIERLKNNELKKKNSVEKQLLMYINLSDDQKIDLLLERFVDADNILENASYAQLINFLKILNKQLTTFANLPYFKINYLKEHNVNNLKTVRTSTCQAVINKAREDSWSTVTSLKNNQKLTNKFVTKGDDKFEDMMKDYESKMNSYKEIQFKSSINNSSIFFGTDCLKFLYKNKNDFKGELRIMYDNLVVNEPLIDYERVSPDELIVQLAQALSIIQRYEHNKEYS